MTLELSRLLRCRIQNALIDRTLFEQFFLELRIGDDAFLDK
jgi:hypothetical protein